MTFLWAKNSDGFDGNDKLCYLRRPSQYVIPAFSTKVPPAGINNTEDDLGWAGGSIGMKMCKTICRSFYQLPPGLVSAFFWHVLHFAPLFTWKLILHNASNIHKKKKKIIMLHFAFIFLCRSFSQVQSWGSFVTHVLLCQTFHQVLGINTEIAPKIYEGNNDKVMLRVFFTWNIHLFCFA